MNNQISKVHSALRATLNGEVYRIQYTSKDGEKSLVARVIPYHKSKQGKEALAMRGEIKESAYAPANGYGEGVVVLKSNPESELYFTFQKQTRNEKGHWDGNEIRTMKASTILNIEKA